MERRGLIIAIVVVLLLMIANGIWFLYLNKQAEEPNIPIPSNYRNVVAFFESVSQNQGAIVGFCKDNQVGCYYYCKYTNPRNGFCDIWNSYLRGNLTGFPRGNSS